MLKVIGVALLVFVATTAIVARSGEGPATLRFAALLGGYSMIWLIVSQVFAQPAPILRYQFIVPTLMCSILMFTAFLLADEPMSKPSERVGALLPITGLILFVLAMRRSGAILNERFIASICLATPCLPVTMLLLEAAGMPELLSGCDRLTRSDYAWYVLDCLAKGGLGDVLESFQVDLFRCRPNRSWSTSVTTLLIRSYSSIVIVWFGLEIWRRRRQFISPE